MAPNSGSAKTSADLVETEENERLNSDLEFVGLSSNPFKNALQGWTDQKPRTLVELRMIKLSYAVRKDPEWASKLQNSTLLQRWHAKLCRKGHSENMRKYLLDQFKYLASFKDDPIQLSLIDGIFQSQNLIHNSLRQNLMEQASGLEDIPPKERDWQPGSNEQTFELINPSLYCLVYGVTRRTRGGPKPFREWCGSGTVIPEDEMRHFWSNSNYKTERYVGRSQLIPTDIRVDDDGAVKLESYVNNLHPQDHKELYGTLEKVLGEFIPMFERVLTSVSNLQENVVEITNEYSFMAKRPIAHPLLPNFTPPKKPEKIVNLKGRKLQVIVKMVNIELSPEKGFSINYVTPMHLSWITRFARVWHVEGMRNEGIVATGIYYYALDNIHVSKIKFRQAVRAPQCDEDNEGAAEMIYGMKEFSHLNQELGAVTINEGLCLAFPNIYQHRVGRFRLADPTKNGVRKILVFFLADPSRRILSTSDIPPQQKDWMVRELQSDDLKNLPAIPERKILEELEWPLTLEQAREYRKRMTEERKSFVISHNTFFERRFELEETEMGDGCMFD